MIKNQIGQTLRFLQPQLLTLDDVPKKILDTSTTINTKFDPEAINERIMQGDTTALEELQNEKGVTNFSSKETTFTNNGKTYTQLVVKYTYNGSKYNVICRKEVNTEEIPTTGAEAKTSEFKNYSELRNYIYGSEGRNAVNAKGITDFSKGFAYEDIADTVAKAHEKDFASITKEQLVNEFVAEYNKRIGTTTTSETPTTEPSDATNADKTELLKSAYKEVNKTEKRIRE